MNKFKLKKNFNIVLIKIAKNVSLAILPRKNSEKYFTFLRREKDGVWAALAWLQILAVKVTSATDFCIG